MVTRIHSEVNVVPEYDPFKDENVIDLGPNERMTIRQTLTVAYNTNFMDILIVGNCDCGCGLIKIVSSSMTTERMFMLAEKLKMAIMDRELTHEGLDGYDPEDAR